MDKVNRLGVAKMKQRLLKFNTPRRIIQVLSFIFFSAAIFNIGALPLLFPVLWTWGLNPNTVGDAFTAIQLNLSGWNGAVVFPWLALAAFLIVGVLIGKSLCGWICPFGFIQDLVGSIKRKQTDVSARTHQTMIYVKYFVLFITLFVSGTFAASTLMGGGEAYHKALGVFADAPFTILSPSETLFASIPRMIHDFSFALTSQGLGAVTGFVTLAPLFWIQFAILVAVLVLAAYIPRGWCRYVCPHGAFMAIMNRFSLVGLRREPYKCEKGGCGKCVQVCPTRVPILDLPWEKFSDPECIYCMKCVDACENKAIKITYP
jgi:ferredoxin-type protein NapH